MRFALVTSLVCLALLAACGGSTSKESTTVAGDGGSRTPVAREDDKAQAMLLTVAEFPTGWSEEPKASDHKPSPLDTCDPGMTVSRTGHAGTGDFSKGRGAKLRESISIYPTSDQISSNFGQLSGVGDCVVKKINSGDLDDDKATYSDASFSRLSFPPVGDRSEAYRFKFHAKLRGETGLGSQADVYQDVVFAQTGRVAFSVQGFDVSSPVDPDDLETYAKKAAAKIVSP